jgi:hypothetical protein
MSVVMSARVARLARPRGNAVIDPMAHAQKARNARAAATTMSVVTSTRVARLVPPQGNAAIDRIAHAQKARNAHAAATTMNVVMSTRVARLVPPQGNAAIDPIAVVKTMSVATNVHAANHARPLAETQNKIVRSAHAATVPPLEDRVNRAARAARMMIAVNAGVALAAANRANRNRNEFGKS